MNKPGLVGKYRKKFKRILNGVKVLNFTFCDNILQNYSEVLTLMLCIL